MADLKRTLTRASNRLAVRMYRACNGRISSAGKDVHVLIITTPGRRTAVPRSACVRYLAVSGGFVVWGTGSGSPRDPDWFENLRAAQVSEVQVKATRLDVRPRELVGQERDAMWNGVIFAQAPAVARYARRAGRTIPVAILTALDGTAT